MDNVIYSISWTRTKDGRAKLKRFVTDAEGYKAQPVFLDLPVPPYGYATKEIVETKGLPEGMRAELVDTANQGKVYRIMATEPSEIPGVRDYYGVKNTWEMDVPYGRRVLIDRDLTVSLPKRRLYVDIETDGREGVPDEVEAKKRIISIAAVDEDGNEHFFSDEDEVSMIGQFLVLLDRYPVVCTWYGNRFDMPYLMNRSQRLDMRFWWDPFVHIDLLVVYRDVLQLKSERDALGYIADKEELPHRKSPVKVDELWASFEGDKAKLRDRNVTDAHIIRDLDRKLSLTPIIFDIAKATHTSVKDLLRVNEKNTKDWNPSVAIDGLTLFLSGRRVPPVIWPSKEFKEDPKTEEKFTGALVLEPVPGVHRNVVLLDVRSLYPSLIRTLNVGPETYRPDGSGDIKAPIGSFVSEPESVMAEAIRSVTELREQYRREKARCEPDSAEYKSAYAKEYAMKVVNNAVYGVAGSRHSRYFNKDVAENVTLTGRRITAFMKQELESIGYPVVLGDTDSVAFKVPEEDLDIVETAKMLAMFLTERVRTFLEEEFHPKQVLFTLEVDKVCSSLFIPRAMQKDDKAAGVKKRYAALVTWQGRPTLYMLKKGFDMVRHDSTQAQKELQESMLFMKLTGSTIEEQSIAANEWKRKLFAGELDDKLVTWKGLGKRPEDYKVNPPYLRAARMMVESGAIAHINKGYKVSYVKTGTKPEQLKLVTEGQKLNLTEAEYGYVWDSQLKRILDRLDIPADSEKERYRPVRKPRAKKAVP